MTTIEDIYYRAIDEKNMLNKILYRLSMIQKDDEIEVNALRDDIIWIKHLIENENHMIHIIEKHLL